MGPSHVTVEDAQPALFNAVTGFSPEDLGFESLLLLSLPFGREALREKQPPGESRFICSSSVSGECLSCCTGAAHRSPVGK